jgi:hypothetical protein
VALTKYLQADGQVCYVQCNSTLEQDTTSPVIQAGGFPRGSAGFRIGPDEARVSDFPVSLTHLADVSTTDRILVQENGR